MSFWCGYCHELSAEDQKTITDHQWAEHVADIEAFERELNRPGPIVKELTLW